MDELKKISDKSSHEEQKGESTSKSEKIIEDYMIPVKKNGITIRDESEEDGKYMLFNANNEMILVINNSGRSILDLCDGQNTVGRIIEIVKQQYNVPDEIDLSSTIRKFVSTLSRGDLIAIDR